MILVERPGFGLSTMTEDRTVVSFAADLKQLLVHLLPPPVERDGQDGLPVKVRQPFGRFVCCLLFVQ